MAVFLLKAEHGAAYVPRQCAEVFSPTCPARARSRIWIEQLATEGVTAGCGGDLYCPSDAVTRRQVAVFLLKTKEGSGRRASARGSVCSATFRRGDPFAPWIEELYNREVTAGCQLSPLLYCPAGPNTRGQMAVFLTKTFELGAP